MINMDGIIKFANDNIVILVLITIIIALVLILIMNKINTGAWTGATSKKEVKVDNKKKKKKVTIDETKNITIDPEEKKEVIISKDGINVIDDLSKEIVNVS